MVFQSYALFPHMSVRRNVGFGLTMQGIGGAEADRRIEQALALVRLESQIDKLPGQLSGGQQQRVAIARAIVIRPPVVLMDEPLSISMPSCGLRCAPKSAASTTRSARRPFT